MNKLLLSIVLVMSCFLLNAQEFNATVGVNAEQTGNPNLQVFKTLERAISEFINDTKWTEQDYRTEERINCSFFINVVSYDSDLFTATIQVQASRPIFGSSYTSTIFNVNDKQFNFSYLEFQNLNYNPNNFDSNLMSVVAFYLYTILGVDADSFAPNGGDLYFQEAKNIVSNAQSSNTLGWSKGKNANRFSLNDDLLSATYEGYRKAMYAYHRDALDIMHNNLKKGKKNITASVKFLDDMHKIRPNSYLMRVFFDSKADEITSILSGGPSVDIAKTVQILNKIAPTYSSKWQDIKF